MSRLTRRDVLRLAAAVPAAIALKLPGESAPLTSQKKRASRAALKILALVFHGSFAFVRERGRILAVVPTDPPGHDHERRGGEWPAPYGLEEKNYFLEGVASAASSDDNMFKEDSNLVLKGKTINPHAQHFCKFSLPLPKKIHHARWADYTPGSVEGVDFGQAQTLKKITTVWVFEYDVSDASALGIKPAPMGGWVIGDGVKDHIGEFHVFCDAPYPIYDDHAAAMMDQITKLFLPRPDLKLKRALVADKNDPAVEGVLVHRGHVKTLEALQKFAKKRVKNQVERRVVDRTCGGLVSQ